MLLEGTSQKNFIFSFQQRMAIPFCVWDLLHMLKIRLNVSRLFTQSQIYERGSFKKNFIWERKRLITEVKKGNIQTIYLQHRTRDHHRGCKL